MHPYRTACPPEPETANAASDDGVGLAFGVMTFVGAVQCVAALAHSGPPASQTVIGGACFIAGLAWLLRRCHR
jgi:uncharacterized membrane protein YgdD (TMEM256/DUF423 family)